MKLYATIKNTRGGKKNTGDDTRILIELTHKNTIIGELSLYSIRDNGEDLGYRVIWRDENTGTYGNLIREEEKAPQGKMQTGKKCEHPDCSDTLCTDDIPF